MGDENIKKYPDGEIPNGLSMKSICKYTRTLLKILCVLTDEIYVYQNASKYMMYPHR